LISRTLVAVILLMSTLTPTLVVAKPAIHPERFEIDAAHSEVGFSVRFMGLTNVHGRFRDYSGTIMYVSQDLMQSTVTVLIDTNSIDTGVEARDKDLRSVNFFHADSFPVISFQSRAIAKGPQGFVLTGPFSMHGLTKEVAIPFQLMHDKMKDAWGNTRIGFVGSLTLSRKEFGIFGTDFWNSVVDPRRVAISDSVSIDLTIEGCQINWQKIGFGAGPGTRSLGEVVYNTVKKRGLKPAIDQYQKLRQDSSSVYSVGEGQLNTAGYRLLQEGKVNEAVRLFQLNVEQFPQSANVYDSLGEALIAGGEPKKARENYEKSLSLNPKNPGAMEAVRWLKGS
jgi:polyisoprenoid-binding protein YceI